ncbi:protein asteroid homolog 1-like [Acanthaster planci]|uniref:Protein asteroid homolog 1-like n=1 Tax=Acanthaster planci TaxID=133434 RepID=A0A8B7ZMJ2_ACAPL|nr:protein asteroid homolog 1-like [Acanthaster planci]
MGVKGLSSMIEQYPSLFTNHCLHDEGLVIDGYALLFYLYFDRPPCDDGHHGGCYENFSAKCKLFFHNLAKCNVSPYLVFDGAMEKDNKKLAETKSRSLERIRTAVAISGGSGGIAVSPCSVLVFIKVLDDLGIPYVFCDFEADAETAVLANAWNCVAASRDSDFYIMDLRVGYLPLDYLDWKNPRKTKAPEAAAQSRRRRCKMSTEPSASELYIECKKYKRSALCKMFHVKQTLLPVLATAVGNDYKDTFGASLDPFHSFVHSQFSRSKSGSKSHNQIISYLSWLSEKETIEEAVGDMVRHVTGANLEKLKRLIDASLEMYQLSDSEPLGHVSGGLGKPAKSKLAAFVSVPPWFVVLLNEGKVSALCANVLCNKRVFLTVQVEDPLQPSAGRASLNIRSVLYGILLKEQKSASRRQPVVEEYAQSLGTLKYSTVEPVYEMAKDDEHRLAMPGLQDIPAMSETDRRGVLLAAVDVDGSVISGIPAVFQLATCVTVYLLSHADPPVYSDHALAVIVSWLHGVAASRQRHISKGEATPEHLQMDMENSDVHAILRNCKPHAKKYKETRRLDSEVIQAVAQWQQCLLDLENLNKLLLCPYMHPDMAVLYDGPLIHSFVLILKSMTMREQRLWVGSELLRGTTSRVQALFDQLLEPCWPLLLPRQKTIRAKKGKRAQRGASRQSSSGTPAQSGGAAGGNAEEENDKLAYGVRVFSRFAPLGLSDRWDPSQS